MRLRILAGLVASIGLLTFWHVRDSAANGSTDGRYHTCGLVTEQGVTEHLHEFWVRCGQ